MVGVSWEGELRPAPVQPVHDLGRFPWPRRIPIDILPSRTTTVVADGPAPESAMEVAAVRHHLPTQRVSNDDLVTAIVDRNDHLNPRDLDSLINGIRRGWETSGTTVRYLRADGERAIDFALSAAREAMHDAGC